MISSALRPTARVASSVLGAYGRNIAHPWVHLAGLVLGLICIVATVLHYTGAYPGNFLTWSAWLAAVAAYSGSFVRLPGTVARPSLRILTSGEVGVSVVVLILYLVTHLWNFTIAPWNSNGLFDDAAWDIYFATNHAFNGPFQAAFFDSVGIISRETAFHYYITSFFDLFGHNLLVFNAALLVLGFVTVLFTTLTVHRLFRTAAITIVAAFVVNLFPLHYLHVFVGHRYAIAAPLMMVSLYLLYSGFQDRSAARLSLSAFFAAICLGSAIMGKQYILGLAAAAVVVPIIDRKRWARPDAWALTLAWGIGFVIAATPIIGYVAFNSTDYFRREQGLLGDFAALFLQQGYAGIEPLVSQLAELFFDRDTYTRLWLHDFPIIPPAYWLLLVPGLVLALVRRRVELVFLALIPVVSALLSGPYDFRVLLAAPIWVIAMMFTLDAARLGHPGVRRRPAWMLAGLAVLAIIAAGLLPSTAFLWRVSQDTHYQYLLRHRDVAVSRLMQDVVAGVPQPSADMKPDEFNRPLSDAALTHDDLACPESAYAIAHLYLQAFDDRQILAFCDGGNQNLLGREGVLAANIKAVASRPSTGRGLKLMWEEGSVSQDAIAWFAEFERFGSVERLPGSVDGHSFTVRVLTVEAEQVDAFRQAVVAKSESTQP